MFGRILKTAVASSALILTTFAQTIPAGTHITVRMGQEISSGTAKVGNHFEASLAHDLVVKGKTVAKAGAPVRGKVTLAKSNVTKIGGGAALGALIGGIAGGGKGAAIGAGAGGAAGTGVAAATGKQEAVIPSEKTLSFTTTTTTTAK